MPLMRRLVPAVTLVACLACSGKEDHAAAGSGGAAIGGSTATGGGSELGGAVTGGNNSGGESSGGQAGGVVGLGGQAGGMVGLGGQAGGMVGLGGQADVAGAPSESGAGALNDDDAPIVPQDLSITPLAGGTGGLVVIGFTLRKVGDSVEIYAALKNEGDLLACSAVFSVELYDEDQLSVAAGVGGLLSENIYQLNDGSGTYAACLGPGDTGMAQVTGLPADLPIEHIKYAVYRSPHFALDATLVTGFSVTGVKAVGTTFTGTFNNGFSVAANTPGVSVFPVNSAGRPLGIATASRADAIPAGDSWEFTTDSTDIIGVDAVAYATGSPAMSAN